ncbi:DUF2141 domain-containing protein [Halocynthiibacter namhaensis]|uniref:DUF2141 domain-containing protein n=1 Tax=Halocynthiibacter namhaensis TaxID=1290553 RepID=UPI0005796F93|nr:DUF2141 domain-containing protein [Halocynthiibacter namhaensis]
MPSNAKRLSAAAATIILTLGGASLASTLTYEIEAVEASTTGTENSVGYQINIHDVRSDQGNLLIMAFDSEDAFDALDYTRAAGYLEISAAATPLRVDFPGLTTGYTAFFVIHDENEDYDLNYDGDTPSEGYAVSGINDPNGVPAFYSSAVPPQVHNLNLRYWQD